eukprot:gene8715-9646_t
MSILGYFYSAFALFLLSISSAERQDGQFIFGAIIPMHDAGEKARSCGSINIKGVVIAEAIKLAAQTINREKVLPLAKPRLIGYDLRDSCNDVEKAKDFAYEFNKQYRNRNQVKQDKVPISIVLSRFDHNETAIMELLAFEKIPQISYASDNVKLSSSGKSAAKNNFYLMSTYPANFYKLKATVGILKALKIKYITLVVSNDRKQTEYAKMTKTEFKSSIDSCYSNDIVIDSKQSIKYAVNQIKRNPLAKVVVLHLDKKDSKSLFEEAKQQNLTGIIWFSTLPWRQDVNELNNYPRVVEGMINVDNKKQEATGFSLYLSSLKRPYNKSALIQELFIKMGGSTDCISNAANMTSSAENECDTIGRKMILELMKYKSDAAYTIDAVYAFAHGIEKKALHKKEISVFEAMKTVRFRSPLTKNNIKFNAEGLNLDIMSIIYNVQHSLVNGIELIQSGIWNTRENQQLALNKKVLRWKHGIHSTPTSICNHNCLQGSQRVPATNGPLCCWSCQPCPNGTVSERNNSLSCKKCKSTQVANPQQSACVAFKKVSFKWFEPMGEFLMFFITAGMCVTFFTLGIFSQNRECDVVKSADYKIMVFMLFGIGLCFFAPVPLLLEPSPGSCISYVIMFNFGLTIPLAVLFTKSSNVRHRFFDENMELKNSLLGSRPHLIVIVIVLIGQVIIMSIGIRSTSSYVEYHPTEQWNVMYAECSYVKNVVFWIGFAYNVALSIVLNLLSCRSLKINDDFKELKWVCITACCFYFASFIFITCIYSVFGKHVVEAASILIILYGFLFLITYFIPKLRLILYKQPQQIKELGPDGQPLMNEEEDKPEEKLPSIHMSGLAALGRVKVLSLKVKDKKDSKAEPRASGSATKA